MKSMKPFGRRILVKPESQDTVIKNGETNLVERAKVLAIGPEVKNVKEGDTLLFTSFGVDSIDVDGVRHYFLMEDDAFILAIA